MRDRLTTLPEAVSRHVHAGDTVFVGGFGQCIPFAAAHEIIRQNITGLTLCRSGADILFDLMIAAGSVGKVVFGYLGNPGLGLAHAFRRAAEAGTIEVEDWTNFAMVLRLHAGAMGVPFLPTASLTGGDLPGRIDVRRVTCPYTGEQLAAVPALNPDVALVHAQYADSEGNVQLYGLSGDTLDGAFASRRIIATVEQIVPREVIRARPDRTVLPGFRISAVCHVPGGAYPSYVEGFYGRDDEAYAAWDKLARSSDALAAWIDREIRKTSSFADHLAQLPPGRLEALKAANARELSSAS
ncbi:CoA transferase subunit A [Chelatococcus sp. GCM10030263]|uniref:CoA transferase subunit A n=1 Tax=Chelatococcus sp. GCM10030263 TaxID=3273387 RepID=UPI00361B11D2